MKIIPGQPVASPTPLLKAYRQASRTEGTSETRPLGETSAVQVELSQRSREFQRTLELARAAPDVREDRLEAARARLDSVTSREVAGKLLDDFTQ